MVWGHVFEDKMGRGRLLGLVSSITVDKCDLNEGE